MNKKKDILRMGKDLFELVNNSVIELAKIEDKGPMPGDNSSKIFCSEAQLQFELAWELQEKIKESKLDFKVYLEYRSMYGKIVDEESKKEYSKKFYTDILLIDDDSNFIPIEIKYKTACIESDDREILSYHGAQDLGRFDYLWDIERITLLKNKDFVVNRLQEIGYNDPIREYTLDNKLGRMLCGYAIMLTNDPKYPNTNKQSLNNKRPLYYYFCIGNGDRITRDEIHGWYRDSGSINGTWRDRKLIFDQDINFQWQDFNTVYNNNFQYLITKIDGES